LKAWAWDLSTGGTGKAAVQDEYGNGLTDSALVEKAGKDIQLT